MNAGLYLQQFLHALCEWLASFGVIWWMAQGWIREPTSSLVRLTRPSRFWLALLFGVGPLIVSTLLRGAIIKLYTIESLAFARMPVGYGLSIVYGSMLGLAAICAVASSASGRSLRSGWAAGVSATLIAASFTLGALLWRRVPFYMMGEVMLTAAILAVAWACCRGEATAEPGNAAPHVARPLGPILIAGFLPCALLLAAIAVGATTNLGKQVSDGLLWLCCVISVLCGFGAPIALFLRKTAGAIVGGILLLLLDFFIAFVFGLGASFTPGSWH
jgi:hypothetical protein